ncbi:uncharacterized protein LOC142665040 [Rhinoderma darwinii]|uniref:uncharacterized protein LOC142665040 n=1 Tax=Rhinoderma darwinii TaxID=43563 RepID=UPI003F669F93
MGVVYILLFIQGIAGYMVLYQPQNIVSMDVNGTTVITCVSSDDLETGIRISWYYRKWRSSEEPVRVKSCSSDNVTHKYTCKNGKYMAGLEIHNVQLTDSGVYYCTYSYSSLSLKFGNGTNLNVGDKSTSRTSIHILGHLQPLHPHSSLQLACVVLEAHNTVHLYWNISGTYHKGRIISKEESNGTWTVVNFISLPNDTWNYGKKVTCEVWIKSSPISVNWEIPGKGDLHGFVASKCQSFLIPMVIAGILLLLVSILFIRTLKLRDNKTQVSMGKKTLAEDDIVYSELNINHLTIFQKHPSQ